MRENVVSKLLFMIGIALMVIGLLTGVIIAASGLRYGLNPNNGMMWSVLFTYFFAGLVVGLLFVGLSEIVHLLYKLNGKMSLLIDERMEVAAVNDLQPNKELEMTQADKTRIIDYFAGQKILEIISSNQEGYCLVKIMGTDGVAFVQIVDIRGSSIVEVHDPELKQQIIAWYNQIDSE